MNALKGSMSTQRNTNESINAIVMRACAVSVSIHPTRATSDTTTRRQQRVNRVHERTYNVEAQSKVRSVSKQRPDKSVSSCKGHNGTTYYTCTMRHYYKVLEYVVCTYYISHCVRSRVWGSHKLGIPYLVVLSYVLVPVHSKRLVIQTQSGVQSVPKSTYNGQTET